MTIAANRFESYDATDERGLRVVGLNSASIAPVESHQAHGTRAILESVRDLHGLLEPTGADANGACLQTVASSAVMRDVLDQAKRVASSNASVLIEGESGTGKELVARLIHTASRRSNRAFVGFNCAALSESLVESELFGHEKGAFTGATEGHAGRFEIADGGTLLLDEVSEMTPKLQAKLLRVLEEESFERVGGNRTLHVDLRVIATTNRNLQHEIREGSFRADLYYRLNVVPLRIPPLRNRPDDIPALAAHFVRQFGDAGAVRVMGISARAVELLNAYSWPGNVRELRNVIHRACVLAADSELQPRDLPSFEAPLPDDCLPRGTLAEIERSIILRTLRDCGGNKTAAAQILGVTARTLQNKMKLYRRAATESAG